MEMEARCFLNFPHSPSSTTPQSDISPKTVTQQELLLLLLSLLLLLLFHIIPADCGPGTTTVHEMMHPSLCHQKGHISLQFLVEGWGCLRGAIETCWGASNLSTARSNRWPGLHRTVGHLLSDDIRCYLWFSEADVWHFHGMSMAFPSVWQDKVNMLDPSRLLHLPKTLLENQAQCIAA